MTNQFAQDVDAGLSADSKFLSSKYFYDERGDKIFQQIMDLEEYYLTRKEFSILDQYKDQLLDFFSTGNEIEFQLIEFGAGDGTKTKILLEHFIGKEACFKYKPVDISGSVLETLMTDLRNTFPTLRGEPIQDDYFNALKKIDFNGGVRKVILFLGSNIGNFRTNEAMDFLCKLAENLTSGDQVMIGFDLKKDPKTLMGAYDDSEGVTAEFNLNLLRRINRELGADFNLEDFQHVAKYDPATGAMESYLVSKKDQIVEIAACEKSYHFEAWEAIHTEISQKFDFSTIEMLADNAGFEVLQHFTDNERYFVDSLWRLK